jgi:hypothetical protein
MRLLTALAHSILIAAAPVVWGFSTLSISGRQNSPTTTICRLAVAVPLHEGAPFTNEESKKRHKPLLNEDLWVRTLDYEGFGREVSALGKELALQSGDDDVAHLEKIVSWRNVAAIVGIVSMGMTPNPITIIALSTWTFASWTMLAHHTCHGGYNRIDAGEFHSRGFALGSVGQRVRDWCDWMLPEAWNIEHNRLHHYRLNEKNDPDLVQRNLAFLRQAQLPMLAKYVVLAALFPVWKWYYYAPNTFKELEINRLNREGKSLPLLFEPEAAITIGSLLCPQTASEHALRDIMKPMDFFVRVLSPFLASRFIILPAPLLLIPTVGPTLYAHAIVNLILAELVTNVHSFVTIVTNHAGKDLYTFDDAVKPKTPSFYVRQVVGSANFVTGNDLNDFFHGWLNYQ